MKVTEPCPLNGKDLVGECIMDELFDNGEAVHCYPEENKFLGLIDGIPATADYEFGGNKMFVQPLDYNAEKRDQVYYAVERYVSRFCAEEARRNVSAIAETSRKSKSQTITFFYYDE